MITNYNIVKDNIVEALEDIDNFETKMKDFLIKYPSYHYNLDLKEKIIEDELKWVVELIILKDEHDNTEIT